MAKKKTPTRRRQRSTPPPEEVVDDPTEPIELAKQIEFRVKLGKLSVGVETVRIGMSVPKRVMTPAKLDRDLCGRRIGVTITHDRDAASDQQTLPTMEDDKVWVKGVCDIKSFGTSVEACSIGFTFNRMEMDLPAMCDLAQRYAIITVDRAVSIPKKKKAKKKPARASGPPIVN